MYACAARKLAHGSSRKASWPPTRVRSHATGRGKLHFPTLLSHGSDARSRSVGVFG